MSGFSVVPDELHRIANVVRDDALNLGDQPMLKYRIDSSQVGDDTLACALEELHYCTKSAVFALRDNAADLAARLGDAAMMYLDFEGQASDGLDLIIGRG
jgi:hypothetical protein